MKGYAAHEHRVFDEVTRARADALRATENFQHLQADLAEVEDEIQASRRIYNANARTYNTRIQIFPNSIVAGFGGFTAREYFEIQAEAVRIPFGDGTMLAAIKLVFGEDCASGRNLDTGGCLAASSPGPSAGAGSSGQAGVGGANQTAVTLPPVTVPVPPLSGSKAVQQVLGGLLP